MVDEKEFILKQDMIEPEDEMLEAVSEEEAQDIVPIEWAGFI